MKKLYLRFISVILTFCVILNSNTYLNVTYANPAAVATTVEVSGELIQLTSDVVAMFTAQMRQSGIDIDFQDAADALADYFYYSIKDYAPTDDGLAEWCMDRGYTFHVDDSGNKVVSVDDGNAYYVSYDVFTGTYTYDPALDNVDGSLSLRDEILADGTRVKTCVKTTYDTLTKFGASVYDYLHNSSTVEYVPPSPVAQVGNVEQLNNNLQDLIKSYAYFTDIQTNSSFDTLLFDNNSYNAVKNIGVVSYDIYLSDCVYPFADDIDFSTDSTAQFYYFSCIGKLADGRYYLPFNVVTLIDKTSPSVQFTEIRFNSAWGIYDDYNALIDYVNNANWTVRAAFYGNANGSISANNFGDGYLTHYAVSADGVIPDVDTTAPIIKVGDKDYTINPDKFNAWDTPDAATTNVSNVGAWDGNDTVVALPGVTSTSDAWELDDAFPDVLNPADIGTSTDVPSDVVSSDNILDWIKDFFSHFFNRLMTLLKLLLLSLFTISDDFLPSWYDKFDVVFMNKGYHFDFSFLKNSSDNTIKDIYITWKGIKILFMPSKYIYSCASFVRPYVRAFIYFIILLHDRKRFIYLIRGTVPPDDTEFSVVPPKS